MGTQKQQLPRVKAKQLHCTKPQFVAVVKFTDQKKCEQEFLIEFALQPKMGDRFELEDESIEQLKCEELKFREWAIIGISQFHYPTLEDGARTAEASLRMSAMPVDLIWPDRMK